jgi:cardiolipin synthase
LAIPQRLSADPGARRGFTAECAPPGKDTAVLGFEERLQVLVFGRFGADLLTPVGVLIAILVTIHVLLHKRDVGTSMGWMGLAWLSPFAGGLLYAVFGVNRVTRRARVLRQGSFAGGDADGPPPPPRQSHLAPLARASGRITARPLLPGNAVEVLCCGDDAYPLMLRAIAGARRSVALSTYILRDDAMGGEFVEALIAAHRRGVQVRVLLDGIGCGYFYSSAYNRLRRNRVPVDRFMHSPLPWRMPFLNLRTHKKILLADGAVGFTGGMNIGRENVLATRPRHAVRDTHFRLRGPVVGQLAEAFARDWSFVTEEELTGEDWFPGLGDAGPASARVVTSGPDSDIQKIEFLALEAVACARRTVLVQTPYFLPDERLVTALALAALRGVQVDIVLPRRSDHFVMDWALRANVWPLLRQGCRIWLNPPPFDHSKLMVVDDEWCMIGSANWDARSFRLNFELNVEFYNPELAAALTPMIEANKGHPLTTEDLVARALPIRLRDAAVRLMLPYL